MYMNIANGKDTVIIVGGGAAGLMAACHIKNKNIILVEKNETLGKKLLITGKGRCNVTNNSSIENVLLNTLSNPKFMRSSLASFSPSDTMNFFENLGVKLKTERGQRVFPVSDKSSSIVDALVDSAQKNDTEIVLGNVTKIITDKNHVTGVRLSDGQHISAESVLLATGGISYPRTGSTGAGHKLAKEVGHTITELRASLVAICCADRLCAELMGVSLKNVTLTLKKEDAKKPLYSELGEMLFTHFGVSGPLVLSASCFINGDIKMHSLNINLKPALSPQQLDARLLREISQSGTRQLSNIMRTLLPQKMVLPVISLCGVSPDKKAAEITKTERLKITNTLQNLKLSPTALRPPSEAVITSGGVDVREINPTTMQSKLVNGLYMAGEILDIDAFTGGFNLQLAFSTAVSAAKAISEYKA